MRMPWNDDSGIRSLRLAYNAAVSAHSSRLRALTEVVMRGDQASRVLIGAEAAAKFRVLEAREKLHAAMAAAMSGKPFDSLTG
jgi:hypothetical protein